MATDDKKDSPPFVYIVEGDPNPLARVRISNNPQNGRRCWDSQKELKLRYLITIKSQHQGPKYKGPLRIELNFFFHIPKTCTQIYKENDYHYVKPDMFYLEKLLCDICNEVLFEKDARVSEIICRKLYTNKIPRTEFTIMELI